MRDKHDADIDRDKEDDSGALSLKVPDRCGLDPD
jgi:hypothetical protein